MRADGQRTKKLIVAFHFQFANQAAWKCDPCRRQGLEMARACPFLQSKASAKIVWARGEVVSHVCPAGSIRAESLGWVEEFGAWRAGAGRDLLKLPARTAEAFFVLEQELRAEQNRAKQQQDHN